MKSKEEFWSKHIESWSASALRQKEYCRRERLALATFQWWRGRLRQSGSGTASALVPVSPQVVHASIHPAAAAPVRIRTGRFTVEVERGFDREVLTEVLDVVTSR